MKKLQYGITCRECGQRPTSGVDPTTRKLWRQCGCGPYPASIRVHGFKVKIMAADPAGEEMERLKKEARELRRKGKLSHRKDEQSNRVPSEVEFRAFAEERKGFYD